MSFPHFGQTVFFKASNIDIFIPGSVIFMSRSTNRYMRVISMTHIFPEQHEHIHELQHCLH